MISHFDSNSSEETEKLGSELGSRLRGGEVIVLTSDLGGGKTAFVRGMARGMGSNDHVSSPTFTISREYESPETGLKLYHFDFYRLSEPGIIAQELGEVVGDPTAVIAIEWGDIVEAVLPQDKIVIELARTGESSRRLTCTYPDVLHYIFV